MSSINHSAARTSGRITLLGFAAAGALVLSGASAAQADCCLGGAATPAAFHARGLNNAPVALKPVTTVQVSSEAPADYTARVTITVGGRALARATRHGHSDKSWSVLRVPLTKLQRHNIAAAAKHEQRRPIFGVQLRGVLAGQKREGVHYIQLLMSVPGVKAPKTVTDGADLITRISLAGQSVNGSTQHATGRVVIRTPKAGFERTSQDASQTAHFTATISATCTSEVMVIASPAATKDDPATQARADLLGIDRYLAISSAPDLTWALGEGSIVDDENNPTGAKTLDGVAVTALSSQRWMHLLVYARMSKSCSESEVSSGAFPKTLERILRTAQVQAKLAAGPATTPLSLPSKG